MFGNEKTALKFRDIHFTANRESIPPEQAQPPFSYRPTAAVEFGTVLKRSEAPSRTSVQEDGLVKRQHRWYSFNTDVCSRSVLQP